MNIYLVSQINSEHDSFDSMVVIAPDEATARVINPLARHNSTGDSRYLYMNDNDWRTGLCGQWITSSDKVKVELLGKANSDKIKVVCTSFNGSW